MEMYEFYIINAATFWFICAGLLLAMEAGAGFTIVLLFASMAAFSLGILIEIDLVQQSNLTAHFIYFFGFTLFWTGLLYKPLRELIKKKQSENNYSNILGGVAVVGGEGLKKGQVGQVNWSGSVFKAQLKENSEVEEVVANQQVTIVDIKGNIFIVEEKK